MIQRPLKGSPKWPAPYSLVNLLSYGTKDHQPSNQGTITHNQLGPTPLIINYENALQPDFIETFPQLQFPNSSLCVQLR